MGHKLLYGMAVFFTLTGMTIAAAGALEKGGDTFDYALILAVSIGMVAAVHFLPTQFPNPVALLFWPLCLSVVISTQLSFFVNASHRANALRSVHSPEATRTEDQIAEYRSMLATLTARSTTQIDKDLATATNWRARRALNQEIKDARHAIVIRQRIADLMAADTQLIRDGASDPVAQPLGWALGISEQTAAIAQNVLPAILIELVGAYLWFKISRLQKEPFTPQDDDGPATYRARLEDVHRQIAAGRLKATVPEIRQYLRCSQTMAQKVRRDVREPVEADVPTCQP